MNYSKKALAVFLVAILVFFCGLSIAHCVESGGGSIDVDRLTLSTDENATISVKVWRPVGNTAGEPGPAIILIPGGNACLEYMASVSMELARRGYTAFAVDPYTIGRSDVRESTTDLGAMTVLNYVKTLDYVDTDYIGMVGWSAGVGRMNGAAILEDGTINGVKATFGFGAGSPSADTELAINQGFFIGQIDNTYGFGINKVRDINTAEAFTVPMGTDYVEFGTWYGNLEANTGRVLFSGFTGHTLGLVSKSGISAACSFFNDALKAQSGSGVSNLTYGWKEFGTALAFAALIVAMVALCSILLKTPFFSEIAEEDAPVIKADPKNPILWILLLVTVAFGALVAKWAVYNGQIFLNKTKILQIANVNGFVFWLCCLALFSLLLFIVRLFADKSLDKAAMKAHLDTSWKKIGKILLLSFLVILTGYFLVSLGDQFFKLSPRFWKVQANILTAKRLSLWVIYFVAFLIPLLVINYMQTSSYYVEGKPGLSTVFVWMANALPPILFVIYVYGSILTKGLTPITSAAMSRANGTMLDAVILMIPISFVTAYFYRKSKTFYLPAILNAMLFSWFSVGTDLITYLG